LQKRISAFVRFAIRCAVYSMAFNRTSWSVRRRTERLAHEEYPLKTDWTAMGFLDHRGGLYRFGLTSGLTPDGGVPPVFGFVFLGRSPSIQFHTPD
jgi:hypothetical protein